MKVSVVTPVFNGEKTLAECIESVRNQDYHDIEHIIVDGNSTDGTLDIIRQYGVKYVSEPDAGIYDAFNKGVRMASGQVIHILNSDDMYASTQVISQVVRHMSEEGVDIFHGYAEQTDSTGHVVKRIGREVTRNQLLNKMYVAHPSTFIRSDVYREYGDYSVGFSIAADQEFMLRVWDKVHVGFFPIVTTKMRLGGASNSQVIRNYRESLAAALLHGRSPVPAFLRYYLELAKSLFLQPRP